MTYTSRTIRILAGIGAAFLLFASLSLCKLLLALKHQSDFATAFLPAPPRDAFAGKVIWITGASSGIGREMAMQLCSSHDDVKLIISSRRQGALEEVASECRKKGTTGVEAKVLTLDLADHTSLPSKAKEALSMYDAGRVDVLVNNGGVTTRSMARNAGFDVDSYVINVDYLSYVALTKALLPTWESRSDGGSNKTNNSSNDNPLIINTSSGAGKFGVPVRTAYCGAKFAILGWFNALRIEQTLVGYPLNVLNIILGSTQTNVARNAIAESADKSYGESDANIEAGLDPEFVVDRVLASAYAGREEIWIAPRMEMVALYLNQYIPETAHRILTKKMARKYAVERRRQSTDGKDGKNGKNGEL